MKKIITVSIALSLYGLSYAQSIRKDYREFTQQEMNDYVAALNVLFTNGTITDLAEHHGHHFNSIIHTTAGFNGEQFLSWHRVFLLEFEQLLKQTNPSYSYLSLPYWDWTTDRSTNPVWHSNFLALSKLPSWGVTRSIGFSSLGTTSDINNTLSLTTFFNNATSSSSISSDFSHRLESYHNNAHVWVGGTMSGSESPRDPIFYLHHNQVDRLWQQWEDNVTGIQASATLRNINNGLVHYPSSLTSAMVLDSRAIPNPLSLGAGRLMDVWYARNGKVILDGANGNAFVASDVTSPYIYSYTAAEAPASPVIKGEMYVGDLQYDASQNVVADSKGGFVVNNGVECVFSAGSAIRFLPGFTAVNGSKVKARIISAPDAFTFASTSDVVLDKKRAIMPTDLSFVKEPNYSNEASDIKTYPNPFTNKLTISYNNMGNDKVSIEVFSMAGVRVAVLQQPKTTTKGNHSIDWDAAHIPSGVYIIVLTTDAGKKIQKVVKL